MILKKGENMSHDCKLDAVLAEYNDCRREIRIRIQQRTRMTQFYIIGLTAIIGLAVQSGNYFVMAIAPAYAIFMYSMIIGTYFYTDSLANYIREEIELKKIPYILGKVPHQMDFLGDELTAKWETRWLGWETNFEKCFKGANPIPRKKVLYVFSWGVIFASVVSLGYALFLLKFHIILIIVLVSVLLWTYGGMIEWIRRKSYPGKRDEKKHACKQADPGSIKKGGK